MKAQKPVHATKSQEWAAEHTNDLQAMANAWAVDKFWTHTEVEHAQGSSTTNLYLANIGVVGHESEIRKGMV